MKIDGEDGYASSYVEPIDEKHSWRVEKKEPGHQPQQQSLFMSTIRLSWVDRGAWREGKRRWWNSQTKKWRYQENPPGGVPAPSAVYHPQGGSEAIGMDKLAEHIGDTQLTDAERQLAKVILAKLRKRFGDDEKVAEYLEGKAIQYLRTAQADHATQEQKDGARRRLAGVAELLTLLGEDD